MIATTTTDLPANTTVRLSWDEVAWAARTGVERYTLERKRGSVNKHGLDQRVANGRSESFWDIDIEGACAELAFAKFLGIEWTAPIDTYNQPDVGAFHVRRIRKPDHRLIIREDAKGDSPYALVYGTHPEFRVIGWIRASAAKQDVWLDTPAEGPAAWFVPQHALALFGEKLVIRAHLKWEPYSPPLEL